MENETGIQLLNRAKDKICREFGVDNVFVFEDYTDRPWQRNGNSITVFLSANPTAYNYVFSADEVIESRGFILCVHKGYKKTGKLLDSKKEVQP